MSAKLLFAGDFVFSNDISIKSFEFDKKIKEMISEHDIFCCNLEGPIINENCKKIKKIGPNINNNKDAVLKLKQSGCNLLCLANNHIFDYGYNGLKETCEFLKRENIPYLGAGLKKDDIYSLYDIEINGVKISFLNICENGFGASIDLEYGYAYAFDNKVKNLIIKAKENADYLIVISHMGAEHWDFPLPEVRKFYKEIIDLGADIVIAHHPHIPQGWEEYKNKPIFYSLGNFIFDKGKGIQNPSSYFVSIILEKNEKIKYKIVPFIFDNYTLKKDIKNYDNLCDVLHNDALYNTLMETAINKAYEYYKKCYYKVVSYDRGSLKDRLKGYIKRVILRRKFQDIWLYHNLNIETHLWICKRATRKIIENNMEEISK